MIKFNPSEIVLTKTQCVIPTSEVEEHDGIMEQITFEVANSGWQGAMKLENVPWKYVEQCCRYHAQ